MPLEVASAVGGGVPQQTFSPLDIATTQRAPDSAAFMGAGYEVPVGAGGQALPLGESGLRSQIDEFSQSPNMGWSGGIDAPAATQNLSQFSQNAPSPEYLEMLGKAGQMSTLERAYMLTHIMGTAANVQGAIAERREYEQSTGEGNVFDLAMTDAFGQDRRRSGVTSYQDYLRRVG